MIRIFALLLSTLIVTTAQADERFIALSSTTSTQDSGVFGHILPFFRAASGMDVHVVAVGTGQALAIGVRGDADALLVHDRAGEDKFVFDGFGIDRRDVMYNDFVIVGPKSDPAGVRGRRMPVRPGGGSPPQAPIRAPGRRQRHQSNGASVVEIGQTSRPTSSAPGIVISGQGMGPTLNVAAALDAYTLTDRATWANFKNRQELEVLSEGDPLLFNPYGSILVNPAKWPHVRQRSPHLARVAHLKGWP